MNEDTRKTPKESNITKKNKKRAKGMPYTVPCELWL